MQGNDDSQVRRMKISKADVIKYGAAQGCKGCGEYNKWKTAANHNE